MTVKKTTSIWGFLGIAAGLVLVLWPLFHHGFFRSDDGEWMIIRLTAFFQSFRDGQFPVRYLGRLNNGYGYPVANFLYPGFLYVGSVFHALGLSFVDSIKLILTLSLTGTAMFLFLWLRRFFQTLPSVVGVLGFLFAPYTLFDLYRRGSVGEIFAFFPSAVALWALEANKRWLYAGAIGVLITAHNTTALLFLSVSAVLILLRRKWEYIAPTLLGIAGAAFFWIPALAEQQYVLFGHIAVSDPSKYFLNSSFAFLIPWVSLVAAVILVTAKKKPSLRWIILPIFLIALFFATEASSIFWVIPVLPKTIQFPYRFLGVASILGSWIIAGVLEVISGARRAIVLGLLFVLGAIGAIPLMGTISYVDRPESYYATNEGTTTVANEYMPTWATEQLRDRANTPLRVYRGNAQIVNSLVSTRKIEATIRAVETSTIQVNTVYYPGWGILLDGALAEFDWKNSQGVMRFVVQPGSHSVRVEFRETLPRFAADVLSAISIILLLFLIFSDRRTKPAKKI